MVHRYFIRKVLVYFLCALLLHLCATGIFASDYYFDSVNGNDTSGNGSVSAPWQSINKIQQVSNNAQPGDIFYFKAGSAWQATQQDGLGLYESGTASQPITYKAYDPQNTGNKPVFTNPQPGNTNAKVILMQGSYLVLDGIKVTATAGSALGSITDTANGIYVYSGGHNGIKNTEISNVGEGIVLEGSNNLVTSNSIHDLQMIVDSNNNSNDDYGAIGVAILKSDNEISYNTIQNCAGHSYDFAPTNKDGGAFEIFAASGSTIQNTSIHHNNTKNNEGFAELGGQASSSITNNTFSYNLSVDNTRLLYVNLSGTFASSVSGINLYNNTIVNMPPSAYHCFIAYSQTPTTPNMIDMKNNIFSFDTSLIVSEPLGATNVITHTNNLYYQYNGTQSDAILGFTHDSSELLTNPLFVSSTNFSLQPASPAINAGIALPAVQTVDFAGNTVPAGSAPDIGAYEWITTGTPPATAAPTVSCPRHAVGDANCDGKINLVDLEIWTRSYILSTYVAQADFDNNSKIDQADFAIWKTEYLK